MAASFHGCIYASRPDDPHFQLTDEDLRALQPQMVGLPVRVEHSTRDVGRITESWCVVIN